METERDIMIGYWDVGDDGAPLFYEIDPQYLTVPELAKLQRLINDELAAITKDDGKEVREAGA